MWVVILTFKHIQVADGLETFITTRRNIDMHQINALRKFSITFPHKPSILKIYSFINPSIANIKNINPLFKSIILNA